MKSSKEKKKSWRELCEAASHEMDGTKLMALVSELTVELDRHLGNLDDSSYSGLESER